MTEEWCIERSVIGDGVIRGFINFGKNVQCRSDNWQCGLNSFFHLTEGTIYLYSVKLRPDVDPLILAAKTGYCTQSCGRN